MSFYPDLDDAMILPVKAALHLIEQNPGYLDGEDCPFSESVKEFLSTLVSRDVNLPREPNFLEKSDDKWGTLEAETADIYTQLKEFGSNLKQEDVSERLQFFKTATTLLEKIVSLNERALGLKNLHEFQTTVLKILDEVMSAEQRTDVMMRVKSIVANYEGKKE